MRKNAKVLSQRFEAAEQILLARNTDDLIAQLAVLEKKQRRNRRILYLNERLWLSSTFTFAILTSPTFSRAISSSSGAIILHGPHHSAQKSTIIGLSSCVSSRSKFDSLSVIVAEFSITKKNTSKSGLSKSTRKCRGASNTAALAFSRWVPPRLLDFVESRRASRSAVESFSGPSATARA